MTTARHNEILIHWKQLWKLHMLPSVILERGLVLFQVSLPSRGLETSLFKEIMALLQALTFVVTRALDEQVILQHFLTHRPRNEALVSFRIHLHEPSLVSSDLLKLGKNSSGGVVVRCGENLGAKCFGPVLQGSCDVFA